MYEPMEELQIINSTAVLYTITHIHISHWQGRGYSRVRTSNIRCKVGESAEN